MKILVLIHEFPPIGGGGGHVAQDIAHILVERGHQVRVIAPYLNGLSFESQSEGIHVIRIPSLRKQPYSADLLAMTGYLVAGFFIALREIWRFKPDLIHVHFAVPSGVLAWTLHILTGIPYVLTTHLGDVPGGVPEKTDRWFRWVYPWTPRIWLDAAHVIAISEYTRQLALQHYPVPIQVIPNGIDTHALKPKMPVDIHIPPRILFAGRFVPQKNLHTLINVLCEIRDLEWDCVLIGDGALFDDVRQKISTCGLEQRIRLTGWLEPRRVLAEMNDADIFFLPSLIEGISISALQSLAKGLALVMSSVGGLNDLVEPGRNGFLHEASDVDAFASSLRLLLGTPEILQRARLESLKIAERFDLSIVGNAYETVFVDAIHTPTRS